MKNSNLIGRLLHDLIRFIDNPVLAFVLVHHVVGGEQRLTVNKQ